MSGIALNPPSMTARSAADVEDEADALDGEVAVREAVYEDTVEDAPVPLRRMALRCNKTKNN